MNPFLSTVRQEFAKAGLPENAIGAKAYMRNQFEFFGLKTDQRREISKTFFKKQLPPYAELPRILEQAWNQPQREMQYFAIELAACYKKEWQPDFIVDVEKMIISKSWWDTVDAIANWINAPYFKLYPKQIPPITNAWNLSDNIWLQRSSLLFQLQYKKDTDTALLKKYILRLSNSEEFFVQKAIGWILRQYARTNPEWVNKFVSNHELKPLSKREAMKHSLES